jgi:hypothetical protein
LPLGRRPAWLNPTTQFIGTLLFVFFDVFFEIAQTRLNLANVLLDIPFYFQGVVIQYHTGVTLPLASSTRPFI